MTDHEKKENESERDEKMGSLFKAASKEVWSPHDGFELRVMARIESEFKPSFELGALAWKALPFAAAASVAIGILAFAGDSIQTIIYSEIMDPLAIESIMTLLTG